MIHEDENGSVVDTHLNTDLSNQNTKTFEDDNSDILKDDEEEGQLLEENEISTEEGD